MLLTRLKGRLRRDPPRDEARVPADTLVYAVGDIHGRADLLQRLQDRIAADAAPMPESRRVLIYLGDYIDRGLDSRHVLELLLERTMPGFETVHLAGNHDAWLLAFLEDPAAGPQWLENGGRATLYSYGVGAPTAAAAGPAEMADLRDRLAARLPERHRTFLAGLAYQHVEGDYLFVHAGIRPGVPPEAQDTEDLLWIRDPFLASRADFGATVVHGHSVVSAPEVHDNRIAVDTGAYATGQLTALRLRGSERDFLTA